MASDGVDCSGQAIKWRSYRLSVPHVGPLMLVIQVDGIFISVAVNTPVMAGTLALKDYAMTGCLNDPEIIAVKRE